MANEPIKIGQPNSWLKKWQNLQSSKYKMQLLKSRVGAGKYAFAYTNSANIKMVQHF